MSEQKSKTTPRAKTVAEVRAELLQHFASIVDFWIKVEGTERWRMEGIVHSILVTLDGDAANFPAFILAPKPQPSDREYYVSRGENYFPNNRLGDSLNDLVCGEVTRLHDEWHKYAKEPPPPRTLPPLTEG